MSQQRRRGPMGGLDVMHPTEKAKDFKGSMEKLLVIWDDINSAYTDVYLCSGRNCF